MQKGDFPYFFVCLPEGKPPFSYGKSPFLIGNCGFPMVFLWFSLLFGMYVSHANGDIRWLWAALERRKWPTELDPFVRDLATRVSVTAGLDHRIG